MRARLRASEAHRMLVARRAAVARGTEHGEGGRMRMESLAAIARELYALSPSEFIAGRNARAKAAADDGDRPLSTRIRSLGKPSVAAWAVNALVRHRFDEVDEL